MPRSQQEGTREPEKYVSVPQQGQQADATRGKDIADSDPDVDSKSEESDSEIKAVNEEEENSDAEYVEKETPSDGTLCQRMMNCKVVGRMEWEH